MKGKYLIKYFVHGLLYSLLFLAMAFVWVFILTVLVVLGYIIGLIIGLGLLILIIGFINSVLTWWLWFPVKMSFWNVFFHGLALLIVLSIVGGVLITVPNIIFPNILTSVITFIIGAFINGMIGKTIARYWMEKEEKIDEYEEYREPEREEEKPKPWELP